MSRVVAVVATWLCSLVIPAALAQEAVWLEGEAAQQHDFVRHGWYDQVDKSVMSGREWLSHYDATKPGQARWAFRVKRAGKRVLWLRANPFRVDMRWRLDRQKWQPLATAQVRDRLMVSPNPDHRFLGWLRVGEVELKQGQHRFELVIESQLQNHGGVDAICFAPPGWVPSGTTKPGQQAKAGPDVWFPVVAGDDPFSEESLIDVSRLIPKPAGARGFLRRDGATLRFERDEQAVKFWGVNANCWDARGPDEDAAADRRRARYLVKHGVNMVRQHPLAGFLGRPLDPAKLDRYDRWFAELKRQGIYSTWSVFYPLRLAPGDNYPAELARELKDGSTSGVVNFMRPLQDLQLATMQELLEHQNPYTKLAYKDDPALAVVEFHNEDCLFWHWPLNELAKGDEGTLPRHARLLRQEFCKWAQQRYKGEAELQRAWGRQVSWSSGELPLLGAWQLDGQQPNRQQGDLVRFLSETQRGFYARREQELRRLGFRGVTVTTAWRAGGPGADPANLFCDTAADMIDRHNYFGGGAGRHRVTPGQLDARSHFDGPDRGAVGLLSLGLYQVHDWPFAVTEWTQSPPNQWKAESAPLLAFYGLGLQGWDASYHFASSRDRLGDGWPDLSSYVSDTPHYMGQFPALALAVHEGHLQEAGRSRIRQVRQDDLFTGQDALGQDLGGGGHDVKTTQGPTAIPVETLAVERVSVRFGEPKREGPPTKIEPRAKRLVASTQELVWDQRHVEVRAAKTQGLIGFAGPERGSRPRRHTLPAVTIELETRFVSLLVTARDGRPLEESQSVLITALARDRPTGAKYSADGRTLEALGGPPLLLEPVQATLELKGPQPKAVEVLDVYGVPTGETVPLEGKAFRLDGRYQAFRYHLRR